MITRRDRSGTEECIRQHDHAWISGALAERWQLDVAPDPEVCFAVAYHDVAWVGLDRRAWLDTHGHVHTFLDHPLDAKYAAYRAGIDLIESGSPYAAFLCSQHYARFAALLSDERSATYLQHELRRQERLGEQLSGEQLDRAPLDVELLRLLDALSLFVCCNPPGATTWSWYPDGFPFGDRVVRAQWLDPAHVRLDPAPLREPVVCTYPASRWDRPGARGDVVEHEVDCVT